ncbi:MAG TPA: BON domain-containing protein [Acetobacteraceae bacterium]|nr:BON domain-containing protein [Acetobacteraceae bacterium]
MDDPELKRIVEDELAWAPHLDASAVRVSVREGVVRLSGFVSSLAEKRAVERAVWHLRGVRAIAQEIEVLIPVARRRTDDEIAHSAVHVLRWDAEVPDERIQVKVEHGVVTLIGAVDRQFEKTEAEERVHKLAGVTAIDNRIVIRPGKTVKDIAAAVERAFHRNAKLHGAGIVVGAEGSKVTLSGLVPSVEDREAAADLAWRTAGVGDVENRLVVRP